MNVSEEAGLPPSSRPESDQPKLGIRHLLLWGFATAVVMSALSTIRLLNGEPVHSRTYLYEIVGGSAYGLALAGIILGLNRWKRGLSLIIHPGHLLLYLAGIVMILDLGLTMGWSLWGQAHGRTMAHYFPHRQFVAYSASVAVLILVLVRVRWRRIWYLPIAALLLLSLAQVFVSAIILVDSWRSFAVQHPWLISYYTFPVLASFCAATLLIVAVIDAVHEGRKRDWIHWVGVAAFLAMAAPYIIDMILRW